MVDPRSAVGVRLESAIAQSLWCHKKHWAQYCPRFSVPFVWDCRPEHPHNPAVLLPRPQSKRRRGRPPPRRPTPTLKTETQTLLHGNEDLSANRPGRTARTPSCAPSTGTARTTLPVTLAPLYSVVRESMASGATTRESVPSMVTPSEYPPVILNARQQN